MEKQENTLQVLTSHRKTVHSNFTMKDIGKFTATKAREFYIGKLNSF